MAKRILIVDDEEDARTYLEVLLQENGYTTDWAADGDLAWTKVKQFKPDLITLDIIMPRETGVKFYRRLCKDPVFSKTPVIICSGVGAYKELFARDHKTMTKPLGFMEKPIDRGELLKTISSAIGS